MTLPAQDIVELVESIRWSKFGDAKWPRRVLTGPEEFERIASTIESLTADNEALRKENAHLEIMAQFAIAAEARADALAQEVERLRAILGDLVDHDLSYLGENIVIPCASHGDGIALVRRARAALANEEAGR